MDEQSGSVTFVMDDHIKEINRLVFKSWAVINVTFLVSYCAEVLKHNRSVAYFLVFAAIAVLPLALCNIIFKDYASSRAFPYYVVVCYSAMYTFCLFTGNTTMVFTYILPMLTFLVLFHRPKILAVTGVYSLLINIIDVVRHTMSGYYGVENSKEAEIQLALIIFCFTGAWLSSKMYDRITENNAKAVMTLLEQRNRIEDLETDIQEDKLTGLGNRNAYENTLSSVRSGEKQVGVIFCDVNSLKYRNDHVGHQAGDKLLCEMASFMLNSFRTADCFRISGDEFVIVMPGIAEDVFNVRAERFHKVMWDQNPPLAASGWYYCGDVDEAVKNAEIRMYSDKTDFYDKFPEYKR